MKYGRSVSQTDKDKSSTYSVNIDERPAVLQTFSLTQPADFGFHGHTDKPTAFYFPNGLYASVIHFEKKHQHGSKFTLVPLILINFSPNETLSFSLFFCLVHKSLLFFSLLLTVFLSTCVEKEEESKVHCQRKGQTTVSPSIRRGREL